MVDERPNMVTNIRLGLLAEEAVVDITSSDRTHGHIQSRVDRRRRIFLPGMPDQDILIPAIGIQ